MKKRKRTIVILIILLLLLTLGGYFIYKAVVPSMIAKAVISGSMPSYVPDKIQDKLEGIRDPLNKSLEALVRTMRDERIPLEEILKAVDAVDKKQLYAFVDEYNRVQPDTSDYIFDMGKRHFKPRFRAEVFRRPFNEYFPWEPFYEGVDYANENPEIRDLELKAAKEVVKEIIIQKVNEIDNLPIR